MKSLYGDSAMATINLIPGTGISYLAGAKVRLNNGNNQPSWRKVPGLQHRWWCTDNKLEVPKANLMGFVRSHPTAEGLSKCFKHLRTNLQQRVKTELPGMRSDASKRRECALNLKLSPGKVTRRRGIEG